MEPYIIRFEQKRGHYMILERDPPLTRETINDTQLRMLKSCEIPGLLPVETEDLNGCVSLRYCLSGTRMLSESMRTSRWSMAEMMGSLCRVAEILEECRLYMLDADRMKLDDEFIFVGSDWQDLRFTYIPLDMPGLNQHDELERLIIRWIMKVADLDGTVMQNLLRLVTSKDFLPAMLRTYTRQYLAGTVKVDVPYMSSASGGEKQLEKPQPPAQSELSEKKAHNWGIFKPPSGDLQSVSELLGDDYAPWSHSDDFLGERQDTAERDTYPMEKGRWRTLISCTAVFLAALVWRYIYFSHPGQQRLLFCLFGTLAAGAGIVYFWNGLPLRLQKRPVSSVPNNEPNKPEHMNWHRHSADLDEDRNVIPLFAIDVSPHMKLESGTPHDLSATNKDNRYPLETTWLPVQEDRTGLLKKENNLVTTACYLVYESDGTGNRIALQGKSFVIGRSSEAAQHVDVSDGISRAHVELLRVSDQWKVKDLGSRNGSRLNDQPMAPYQLYSLQHDDRLVLANSRYRFVQE